MVYIYKKTVGEKEYYYLRASLKKGNKLITKDIAYLGSSPEEVKEKLRNLPQKYAQGIRNAYARISSLLERNNFLQKARNLKLKHDGLLSKEDLEEVEACRLHYEQFLKRHPKDREETYRNFAIEFAYNTTSIEGNTITLKEAQRLLTEYLTPKDKTLREIFDVQNTQQVFLDVLEVKPELNHETILQIHGALMKNIDSRLGYRTTDVRVFRSHFEASPTMYIKADMENLLKLYLRLKEKLHPLSLAAIFHHKFEKIHPFADGNGRAGRMLLNLILLKAGYPPVIIAKKKRARYLDALSSCDKVDLGKTSEEYTRLVSYLAESQVEGYWSLFL